MWYMAVLNIRNVPEALMQALRDEAGANGRTLRSHVLWLLGDAHQPAKQTIVDRAVQYARPSHDPKTCRIYGCLVCKEQKA
jgi:hypothetical protein